MTTQAKAMDSFGLGELSPAELENERGRMIQSMLDIYKTYDNPDIPEELLTRLAFITGSLRRKTAGPPKATKPSRVKSSAATVDDL